MATYAPLASPTPSVAHSEDIPLVQRHSIPPRGPHSPVSPRTPLSPGALPPHLRPSLKLDTTSYHKNDQRRRAASPPPLSTPPPPSATPSRIPLPTNEHSVALASLRDRVDSSHGQTALVASPTHSNFSPATRHDGGNACSETDVFFAHLFRIRTLGSEVGELHAQMEGVGVGWAAGAGDAPASPPPPPAPSASEDKAAEETKASTTKEFDDTASMFEKRQASIEAIMGKLATLSTSLSDFHSLPTPALGFNSKRSATGRTTTPSPPPSATSSRPKTSSTIPHKRSNLRAGETFAEGLRREAARERQEVGLGIGSR